MVEVSCKYCNGTGIWFSPIMGGKYPCEECPLENKMDDEPTSVTDMGTKHWKVNGFYHRENGPAIECTNGYKAWWKDGLRHRLNGPSQINQNGEKAWHIEGVQLTEEAFNNHPDSITF